MTDKQHVRQFGELPRPVQELNTEEAEQAKGGRIAVSEIVVTKTTDDASTGLSGTTQFASVTAVSSQSQNGYASGEFSGLAIDGTGLVQGLYTNGQKITIGQLAIAKFRSNDGLGRAGQNLWIETRESGTAALGAAGAGGRASVSAGALESSNVDLGEEFVGLIQLHVEQDVVPQGLVEGP